MHKITVDRAGLAKAIERAMSAQSKKPTIDILASLLFKVDKSLYVTGTDLEITLTAKVGIANTEEQFSFSLEPSDLKTFLNELTQDNIDLTIDPKKSLVIEYGLGSNIQFNLTDHNTFPLSKRLEDEDVRFEMKSGDFKDLLRLTYPFTGKDEMKPIMQSICFQIGNKKIRATATDGHQLVSFYKELDVPFETEILIPAKAAYSLMKTPGTGNVKVQASADNIELLFSDVLVKVRLTEGTYPNWGAVVPSDKFSVQASIDREPFLKGIKIAGLTANKASHQIALDFFLDKKELVITGADIETGRKGEFKMPVEELEMTVERERIGYNGNFLSNILNIIDVEKVHFKGSETKALVIGAVDKNLALLMPVLLDGNTSKKKKKVKEVKDMTQDEETEMRKDIEPEMVKEEEI